MTQREQSRRGIGSYVKALMDAHEPVLVQGDVATLLGISQSAASRKLSGERGFDLHELLPIADMLGIPVHQLLAEGLNPTAAETKPATVAGTTSTARKSTKSSGRYSQSILACSSLSVTHQVLATI